MAEEFRKDREVTLAQAALPVAFLLFLIVYGLIARPHLYVLAFLVLGFVSPPDSPTR